MRWAPAVAVVWPVVLAGCDGSMGRLLSPASADSDHAAKSSNAVCLTEPDADELADQLTRLVNMERFDVGAVQSDVELSVVAAEYACDMIRDGFFGHTNPVTNAGVVDRVAAGGYDFVYIGEDLAAGIWTAPEIVDAWMDSPSHREIILDPAFKRIGVAVRFGGSHGIYAVLILADPGE